MYLYLEQKTEGRKRKKEKWGWNVRHRDERRIIIKKNYDRKKGGRITPRGLGIQIKI